MSWFLLNRNLTLLEPYDWKLSRTVLRGKGAVMPLDLPDYVREYGGIYQVSLQDGKKILR